MPIDSRVRLRLRVGLGGTDVDAIIETPIAPEHAAQADELWPPHLRTLRAGDAEWRWADHIQEFPDGPSHQSFALLRGKNVEGLLIVKRNQQMRNDVHHYATGSYMEYMASAPWNRTRREDVFPSGTERVTPVGRVLLTRAVILSRTHGHDGCLGWKVLDDEAATWYIGALRNVIQYPPNTAVEPFPYFEIGPKDATTLIADFGNLIAIEGG